MDRRTVLPRCVTSMLRDGPRCSDALHGVRAAEVLPPEGGFFAMVDISRSGLSSDDVRKRLLNDHGVVVVHGRAYGVAGEGTLRVSFGSGGENLQRGLRIAS